MKPFARSKISISLRRWQALLAFAFLLPVLPLGASDARASLKPANAAPTQEVSGIGLRTFPTHSRLYFKVDQNVPAQWKAAASGFEVLFKGISLTELGAPLGDEDRWREMFKSFGDHRLAALHFTETSEGVRVEGKWKFPSGAQTLADPRMETFDFREREPGQYVIDFWVKKGPTLAEARALKRQREQQAMLKQAEDEAHKRTQRRLASAAAKAEVNDVLKFCREPLNDDRDLFLQFLPFHDPVDFSKWIPVTTPDSQFPYFEPKIKTREAQYVRLALDLYRKADHGLVVKTLEMFEKDYPKSPFRWEMRFLMANALIKLNLNEAAEGILNRLLAEAQDQPVALHSGMYLASKNIERKAHLQALESFLWLMQHHPDHRLIWVFHLGAAESLYALKQTERAQKEYQWVVENAPTPESKAEAGLRIGDLFQDRWQYEQALGAYSQGLRHFYKEARKIPSVHVNRAEALYELGQFDRSKEAFEEFLKLFPGHPAGWRATFRLGEIADRKETEKLGDTPARKWYYQTINHFPFSPGATLARLRLIECGDHGGFSFDAGERFFDEEAARFEGKGAVSLARYPEFRGLARVRALISWGKEEDAIDTILEEFKANRSMEYRKNLAGLYDVLFRRRVHRLLEDGRKFEALKFYSERYNMVRREGDAADPDYLLRLSQAASDLGLGKLAAELTENYQKALDFSRKHADTRGPAAEKDQLLDLDARLKDSEKRFTVAKALWMASGTAEAEKIREELAGIVQESPYFYEREVLLALVEERLGKSAAALPHLVKAQLHVPSGASSEHRIRLEFWLASLEFKTGDATVALEMFRNLESRKVTPSEPSESDAALVLGVPLLPGKDAVLIGLAEVLEKLGKWGEAAAVYSRAVDQGVGGNHAKYGYARALLKSGDAADRKNALGILEAVAASKDNDFWKRLAGETLANEKTKFDAKEGGK